MSFKFTRKHGQKIIVLNDEAMPISIVELKRRTSTGTTRINVSVMQNGRAVKKELSRRDGDQFETGGIVFSIAADEKPHRTVFKIEKNPPHLQVAKYEKYQQALNG